MAFSKRQKHLQQQEDVVDFGRCVLAAAALGLALMLSSAVATALSFALRPLPAVVMSTAQKSADFG
jgi:hypothetical protein